MGIKITRGYRVLSKIPVESLDLYIKSFTSGSGETILLGKSDTLDTTITRGTRKSDGEGNALSMQGGQATGTNEQGGDVNIFTGYPTGNGAAGDFKVLGALTKAGSGSIVNPTNDVMLTISGDTGNVVINGSLTVGSTEVISSSAQISASTIPTLNQNTTGNAATATTAGALAAGNQTIEGNITAQTSGVPLLTLKRTSTGSDGDSVGAIRFSGNDDADNALRYAAISAKIIDASNGAEEGQLNLAVASHDGEEVTGLSLTSGDAEDEVDVTIGNGSTSLTTVAGTLTMGSTAFVNNSGVIQVATQGTINHNSLANYVANEHIDWTSSSAGTIHSTNIPTLNQDTTGNADTATALTSGDKTIAGDLTVTSGTSGDATLIISADTDNNNESDNARLWFKQDGDITEGAIQMSSNVLNIINNISASGGISFQTGTTNNTGTTDPSTGATERMSIASDGVVAINNDTSIEGNLRIGGSGDTSNNWITIDAQNGDDTSGGGICFYETGTDTIGAPQFGAKIVYNEDDDELAIGTMHSGSFQRQIHMDRGSTTVNMQNIHLQRDTSDGPFFMMTKTDTSVADGDSLCRIIVRNSDRGTGTNNSQIQWFATEDHDSDSCGTKINFTVTPNGNSQSETTAMTINQDSSISIPGTIELGHESDTTIARSAAGTVTIEGNQVVVDRVNDPGSGQNGPIATKIARRTLTTAECNDLHNTPIEIIPAQGANSIILITGGMIRVDRAANQNNASCDFNLHFDGKEPGAFGSSSIAHFRRFHNGATTDGIYNIAGGIFSGRYATTLTEDINKAVEVSFDAAATTDCFTSIDIYLTYCVITQ